MKRAAELLDAFLGRSTEVVAASLVVAIPVVPLEALPPLLRPETGKLPSAFSRAILPVVVVW